MFNFECPICFYKKTKIISCSRCNNSICYNCYNKLILCPFCRYKINCYEDIFYEFIISIIYLIFLLLGIIYVSF